MFLCRLSTALFIPVSSHVMLLGTRLIFSAYDVGSCAHRSNRFQWDTLSQAKGRILSLLEAPHASAGVKLATIKFLQRVILVQTRGVTDPRVVIHHDVFLRLHTLPNVILIDSPHVLAHFVASKQGGPQFDVLSLRSPVHVRECA
jgi:hypothetical protein